MKVLPLSIRDVAPHPDAERITGTRADGLPDGVHTGGAWLWQGRVYKPLDGRPSMNADAHYPTQEAEMLADCQDVPLFPKNWEVEELNERRFLVRDQARVIVKSEKDHRRLNSDLLLQVEQSVREVNRRGWEIGDVITLGFARGGWFIVDLSTAFRRKGQGIFSADEEWRILDFFRLCGRETLVKFRCAAKHAVSGFEFYDRQEALGKKDVRFRHVYASFNRPFSLMWASTPPDTEVILLNQKRDGSVTPHTWICTNYPLSDDYLQRYELTWGWSAIHANRKDKQ